VLRRVCGPKREKVARGGRRMNNEELHNLYASAYRIGVQIKYSEMDEHVARMGDIKVYKNMVRILQEIDHSGNLGVDEMVILE
jgi:hypothetical protein